jgi:hypothetical protein
MPVEMLNVVQFSTLIYSGEFAYVWNGLALISANMRQDLVTRWHCMPQRHSEGPTMG